jgi:hypothetical protein
MCGVFFGQGWRGYQGWWLHFQTLILVPVGILTKPAVEAAALFNLNGSASSAAISRM